MALSKPPVNIPGGSAMWDLFCGAKFLRFWTWLVGSRSLDIYIYLYIYGQFLSSCHVIKYRSEDELG